MVEACAGMARPLATRPFPAPADALTGDETAERDPLRAGLWPGVRGLRTAPGRGLLLE